MAPRVKAIALGVLTASLVLAADAGGAGAGAASPAGGGAAFALRRRLSEATLPVSACGRTRPFISTGTVGRVT